MFGNGVVLVEKEEEIFPFQSFVAECGGCLGLFIGFSFLLIWDISQEIFNKMLKILRKM